MVFTISLVFLLLFGVVMCIIGGRIGERQNELIANPPPPKSTIPLDEYDCQLCPMSIYEAIYWLMEGKVMEEHPNQYLRRIKISENNGYVYTHADIATEAQRIYDEYQERWPDPPIDT